MKELGPLVRVAAMVKHISEFEIVLFLEPTTHYYYTLYILHKNHCYFINYCLNLMAETTFSMSHPLSLIFSCY